MSTSAGQVLAGRYRLLHTVGRGGTGEVWAAHDELLGRDVAVKQVAPPQGQPGESATELRTRALREARAAARVGHPCAVTVFDVAEHDGRHWIVMELLPPRTLADELARTGTLTPEAAARIGLDLLDALSSAHAAGVLHRDVKPANVLLTQGRAVLADFGIATLDGDAPAGEHGLVVGSPAYMAPERARGEAPSPASDLWALGATLYAAVEGRAPFWRQAPLPTLDAVLREDAPPAEHAGPLGALLAALLARDPQARPDAALTRRVLLGVLASPVAAEPVREPVGGTLALPVPAPDVAGKGADLDATAAVPRQRRRAPLAMAACAVTLLGLGGVVGRSLGFDTTPLPARPQSNVQAALSRPTPAPSPSTPAPTKPAATPGPTALPHVVASPAAERRPASERRARPTPAGHGDKGKQKHEDKQKHEKKQQGKDGGGKKKG
jgi:tRNA A-37 threonylcarbamoyl transferase component Bud32